MIGIFFIATAWGRSNGGINSVNTALMKSLSGVLKQEQHWKLFCVVTQRGEDADTVDELQDLYQIKLIKTETPVTSRSIKREIAQGNFSQLFFVGHDIITGHYANQLRDAYKANSVSIIFHHMDYKQYYYLRESDPKAIREKEESQLTIIPSANIIVSIGPSLEKSAQDLCKDARKEASTKVYTIIPGMEVIDPIDGIHHNNKVILFGRLEDRNNAVKQIELAIDALGQYLTTSSHPEITIRCYGYIDDSAVNQKKLVEEISKTAGKAVPITANSYISDEQQLFKELASASLCIMPSVYEGFGLTGYEAIAAGVPVIISKNTGLFQFLNSWKGKSIHGLFKSVSIQGGLHGDEKVYSEQDLNTLAQSIQEVFSDYKEHKRKAMELRKTLLEGECSWGYAARAFVEIIKGELKTDATASAVEEHRHIREKQFIGIKQHIVSNLIPEFCTPFCDTEKLICKVIKYSNDRSRRFTAFSSHELTKAEDNRLRIRAIDDGTVGVLNRVYSKMEPSIFPIILSDFTRGQCLLLSGPQKVQALENQNIGVPDHQVLAIIAVPLVYADILVGALTLDIYDQEFITRIQDTPSPIIDYVYMNMRHFSQTLTNQFYMDIKDDLNFSEVQKMIADRAFVSFAGKCPLNCKHCFAKEIVDEYEPEKDIPTIIAELANQRFDVVYVSHYNENFFDPERGIELCEEIYKAYNCDICITTRCALSGLPLRKIKELNRKMKESGNCLSFCISIPALHSYAKIENAEIIATPSQRIDFAGQLKALGVCTFVTIRPLFPSTYIPTDEIHQIVDSCADKVNGILTGGLCVTDGIIEELQIPRDSLQYLGASDSEYLQGVGKDFLAVNVEREIQDLEVYCKSKQIPFFRHSMEALNYFKI